tara:strand:- start:803 stop:1210 length:408 start_codon:yes stop_codon:yes gene_type:complete
MNKKEYHRQYYIKNKSKWQEGYNKDKPSPPFVKAKYDAWVSNNMEAYLVRSSLHGAKQRGLEHTITKDDVVIPTHCPLLGVELVYGNTSLDRIDNTKGYVPGNVEVLSSQANYMKRNATINELKTFATNILSHYS